MEEVLARGFYARATEKVARELLGMALLADSPEGRTAGRIVETEAYLGVGDPASHAHRGPTPRSSIMFGRPGVVYVYFTYGMYHLFNVVTEDEGTAGAVLVRALAPTGGVDLMRARRERWRAEHGREPSPAETVTSLADGPGKLTIAMGIDLADNGRDLASDRLRIERTRPMAEADVERSARVGIRVGTKQLLRFSVKGDPHVSKARSSSRRQASQDPRPSSRASLDIPAKGRHA